jgi:beta-N-acetylhexosaminidase
MSAHVNYPALEGDALESGALEGAAPESTPKLPATLSPKVLTGLLRDELKFDGLLMTDSLEMGALGANGYAPDEAAARALAAGADLLAFNTDLKVYRKAHARIVQGVRDGEIPMARLDDAVRRVLRAKERYGILDASADSSNSSSWVGSSETRQRIAHVIAKTITLSRDDARLLPLLADTPLLVIETPYAYGLSGSLDRPGARVNERPTPGQINSMIVRAKGRIALVATSDIARNPTQADLVRALIGAGVPTIVWAVKSPYDLLYLRDTLPLTFIATYGTPPYLLIQPMLDVLYGRANATGRLPVDLP